MKFPDKTDQGRVGGALREKKSEGYHFTGFPV
jgi:hypothetical protein